MRAILVFVNFKFWSVNKSITVPPRRTGSLWGVVPAPVPGSQCSRANKMPRREGASLLYSLGRAPWDAGQAFFSPLETCLLNYEGEWYLPNHSSPCTGIERALLYFDRAPFAGLGWAVTWLGLGFIVWLALQMLDPLSSAENSLSGSCQSLDRSADRYGTVAALGVSA